MLSLETKTHEKGKLEFYQVSLRKHAYSNILIKTVAFGKSINSSELKGYLSYFLFVDVVLNCIRETLETFLLYLMMTLCKHI